MQIHQLYLKSDPATQSLVDSIKAEPGFTDGSEVSQNAEQPGTVEITPAQEIAKKSTIWGH